MMALKAKDSRINKLNLSPSYMTIAREARRGRYKTEEDLRRKICDLGVDEALLKESIKGHYILFAPYERILEPEEVSYDKEPYEDNLVFEISGGVLRLTDACEERIFGPPESSESKKLKKEVDTLKKKVRDLDKIVKDISSCKN